MKGKDWIEARETQRDTRLEKKIHQGVVAALNNGGAEPVRRLLREEVGQIVERHEQVVVGWRDELSTRVARLEAKRR